VNFYIGSVHLTSALSPCEFHLCIAPQFWSNRAQILHRLPFRCQSKHTSTSPYPPRLQKIRFISAPRQNFNNLVETFFCMNMKSLSAKFQLSSFQTEGGVWGDRHTDFFLRTRFTIVIFLAPFARICLLMEVMILCSERLLFLSLNWNCDHIIFFAKHNLFQKFIL